MTQITTRTGIARAGVKSRLEEHLAMHIRVNKLPPPVREFQFHPERRWRYDFAWPVLKIAAECEGAIYVKGRHTTGAGFEKDAEKYNAAALMGWTVLRFTRSMIASGNAIGTLQEAISLRTA